MKYSYENIVSVHRADWNYEEKPRDAVIPSAARMKPRFVLKNGVWTNDAPIKSNRARLILAGDMMCQEKLIEAKKLTGEREDYNFDSSFRYVRQILEGSDLAIANLESVIHPEAPYANEQLYIGRYYNRNGPPQYLEALRYAGFDLLTASNNHMVDTGMRGLYRTNEYLDQYGFIHTGSFTDSEEQRFALVDVNGIRVGVLSYTMCFNFKVEELLTEERRWMLNYYTRNRARSEIASLREAGADFIICYIHWGTEMVNTVNDTQKRVAQELADLGVDYIAGSHPHVIQPYDVIKAADGRSVPVIYSLGNLISHFVKIEPKTSIMLELDLTKREDGKISCKDSYLTCYTFGEYDGERYVTVPLLNRVFRSEETKTRMRERKKHVAEVLGTKIAASHNYDLQIKQEEDDSFSLVEALMGGDYLLPDSTQMQAQLLDAYRVSEAFKAEYCDYMLRHYRSGQTVRTAISVAKKATGTENISVEKNWKLLSDMIYAKRVLGFSHWEYFAYGLPGKTPAEMMEFVPESVIMRYYRRLNINRDEIKILNDKYLGYEHFKKYYKRDIVKISEAGDERKFARFCAKHKQFITKPLDASCGKGILFVDTQKYEKSSGLFRSPALFRELMDTYVVGGKTAFLCEELIHAHPDFAAIHPESVNSLRVFTYYDGVEPRVILAWLKSGRGSAVVDNGSAGGLLAAIDCKTGVVTTPARNEGNETFEKHPDTGFPFVGFRIEGWGEAVRTVKEAAQLLKGVRVVGWDIALSADKGWQIVEGNAYGMFNLLQVATQQGMRRWFLKEIEWQRYRNG